MNYVLQSVFLVVLSFWAAVVTATDEPAFTVLATMDDVEIRQYGPAVQARTSAPASVTSSRGFRTLAGYIFGGNSQEQEIAMTAPVERSLARSDNYMAFYMPEQFEMEGLPAPDDSAVTLHAIPARVVAVLSFSGWTRESVVQDKVQALLGTLSSHGIETSGEPTLARYNPPWTPPWSRRNEVMVEIPVTQEGWLHF